MTRMYVVGNGRTDPHNTPLGVAWMGGSWTPAEMPATAPGSGWLWVTMNPPAIYASLGGGTWHALGSGVSASGVPYGGSANLAARDVEAALDELDLEKAPASHVGSRDGHPAATATEAGFITGPNNARIHDRLHGMASQDHSDVRNAPQDGQAQIFRLNGPAGTGHYYESPGAAGTPNATATEAGKVEKGTRADYDANTDAGTSGPLYAPITLLKALLTPEAVRLVGAAGEPSFLNGWSNHGTPFEAAGFYKDPMGRVHLRGTVKGTALAAIFALPEGYRPAVALPFTVTGNDARTAVSRIVVQPTGSVFPSSGSVAELSLNGISFRV